MTLNGALVVEINYEKSDSEYDDNICLCFEEPCPENERMFRANQTNFFVTPQEARLLAEALLQAAEHSDIASKDYV